MYLQRKYQQTGQDRTGRDMTRHRGANGAARWQQEAQDMARAIRDVRVFSGEGRVWEQDVGCRLQEGF